MKRRYAWRVRVRRLVEDWVDVDASTAREAEEEARKCPGVVSVFPGSALPADEADKPDRPPGVEDGGG